MGGGGLSVSRLPIPSSGFLPLIRAVRLLLSLTPPPAPDGRRETRSFRAWNGGGGEVGWRRGGVGARRRREG